MKIRVLLRLSSRPFSNSAALLSSEPKPFTDIPGLKGRRVLGNIPEIISDVKNECAGKDSLYHKLHLQFGSIYKLRLIGKEWHMHISSPEDAETMSRAEGKYPTRGEFEESMTWIFRKIKCHVPMSFSKGEEWKKTRSAAAKQVVPRQVGNFVSPLCGTAEELLDHLEDIMDESGNIPDITPELAKWALQGVSYFVYGEKINIYSGMDHVQKEFVEACLDYVRSHKLIATALPLYKLFPTKPYKDFVRIVRRMQGAGRVMIKQKYNNIKEAITSGFVDETKAVGLLDQWLIEGKFTEEGALSQSFDMLSAGIDTTKNTAAFLLYELSKQPEVQDQLVQEISSVVGEKEHPTWEDLQNMTLVRNCMKEALRMYAPIYLPRVLAEDVILSGYHVPAGTTVVFDTYDTTMDEKVFKDSMKFKPERWKRENSASIHPFSSLPFGFGPRACYGRRLAELEIYILLTKLLPKYELSTNTEDMKVHMPVLLAPSIPLHIKFRKREFSIHS